MNILESLSSEQKVCAIYLTDGSQIEAYFSKEFGDPLSFLRFVDGGATGLNLSSFYCVFRFLNEETPYMNITKEYSGNIFRFGMERYCRWIYSINTLEKNITVFYRGDIGFNEINLISPQIPLPLSWDYLSELRTGLYPLYRIGFTFCSVKKDVLKLKELIKV